VPASIPRLEEVNHYSDERIYDEIIASDSLKPPAHFEALLAVAVQRKLSILEDWFRERLRRLVEGQPEQWIQPLYYKIVGAATQIIPGHCEENRNHWLLLLNHPDFGTLAYGTLVRDLNDCWDFLPIWWSGSPDSFLLRHILKELFTKRERWIVRRELETRLQKWPESLARETNKFLSHGRQF
jgi:hypothetical protein